ncbi:MAG: tRNA (adenosine(37)-N6)-dimethylallyltransferase MiaA [Polyangiales bacterium]
MIKALPSDPVGPDTRPAIVVIAGPTAVGKTQHALALARRFDGELIGADSVQVYRGFDIGASKPTAAELDGVPHHLIDIREPAETLDAAGYAALADRAIADVAGRGKLPIVVGGTGLWLRALLRGLVAVPPVDAALRAQLEAEWDAAGSGAMHTRLQAVDPLSAERIHPHDKLRVVRALEVYAQTGQPLGAARQAHALGLPRYRGAVYVLDMPASEHRLRVEVRVRAMLEAGLVAETAALLATHGPDVRALGSVGYRQVVQHLREQLPLPETEAAIVRATLIYARRQRTWWGTDPSLHERITPDALHEPERLAALARALR